MALVVSGPYGSQPEKYLAQALKEYEAVLSNEERLQLRAQGVPSTRDAINLTIQLDQNTRDRRRHCMGARLITILESLQQFSAAADTFVSSHPEVGALVWGGVKLALLVISSAP